MTTTADWDGNIRRDGLVVRNLSGLHPWWVILGAAREEGRAIDRDAQGAALTSGKAARDEADRRFPLPPRGLLT